MLGIGLSSEEIEKRLIRLHNLEPLHKKAQKRILSQAKEIKRLKERIKELEAKDKEKDKIIQSLAMQIEEIKTKVFGKKKDRGKGASKERAKADRDKSSYQRPIPEITKEEDHLSDNCSTCNTKLKRKKIVIYYEEDIVLDNQKEAIKHNVEQGYCEICKKWRSAIPLPSARCIIGVKLRKYICYLSIILRLSHQQIEDNIKDIYQINISQGEIQKILEKEANSLRPEYERLKVRVQEQFAQHYDETSWKVVKGVRGNHAWIMTGTENPEAVFLLGQSRGKGNVSDLNPKARIGITDNYGAYKNIFEYHQLCWAHLYRNFRDFAESDILNVNEKQKEICLKNYQDISLIYQKLKATLETKFEYEKTYRYFLKKLTELSKPNILDFKKLKTIKETLSENKEKYLTCLKFPGLLPMDNNKAERGLRHLVIKRKISYGSKTERGAETTSILASVLLSLKWMNPGNFFQKYFALSH
jgi:hypothetical protein